MHTAVERAEQNSNLLLLCGEVRKVKWEMWGQLSAYDSALKRIITVWQTLPEAIRSEVDALCFSAVLHYSFE